MGILRRLLDCGRKFHTQVEGFKPGEEGLPKYILFYRIGGRVWGLRAFWVQGVLIKV